MDWPLAIERNRERLLFVIVALMASLGLINGYRLTTLPHFLYRQTLAILLPAEAALRRLIVMAADQLELGRLKPRRSTSLTPAASFLILPPRSADFIPAFQLIEPLKIFGGELPDFASFGASQVDAFSANGDGADCLPVPAQQLGLRLLALKRALDNLPRQAMRLASWYVARDSALQNKRPHRLSPMRPGLPPAYQKRPKHDIGNILLDCHSLALCVFDRRGVP